eukprot:5742619-Prymnesium_polylepis.1
MPGAEGPGRGMVYRTTSPVRVSPGACSSLQPRKLRALSSRLAAACDPRPAPGHALPRQPHRQATSTPKTPISQPLSLSRSLARSLALSLHTSALTQPLRVQHTPRAIARTPLR